MELIPSKETFELIQTLNFDQLEQLPKQQVRLVLPCLVRMCLCTSLDVSDQWKENRKKLKKLLLSYSEVNVISSLLNYRYSDLEIEVKREMQLRFKPGTQETDSYLLRIPNPTGEGFLPLDKGLIKLFEQYDEKVRYRIVLAELTMLMSHVRNFAYQLNSSGPHPSEVFDASIYLDEITDLLYFAISEMPNLFQLIEVVDALLVVKNGLKIICCLIANFPDSFHEICMTLINNGGNSEEDSYYSINRVRVLRSLCQMNPNEALLIRGEAVELCRMPNLVVMLTLDHVKQNEHQNSLLQNSKTDVISFITGILLSNDDKVRSWFSQYIKISQKKAVSASLSSTDQSVNSFMEFRNVLLSRFKAVTELVANLSNYTNSGDKSKAFPSDSELILTEACIMLRLYCALRGVASMKFTDEETLAICRMIVCRPRHSYIGVRFVSFGLCMILAFPQLVTVTENEGKIVEWIKWLVQEESYLGKVAAMKSSFGEMLLLIAIHFHNNQISAIGDLVSSTIGIKLPIRINDLNRIKNIFTQEIFPEQTVAAHSVKVPVTRNLNNSVSGFLPVHCIFQLLKSRAFTKNKVPIKDWIFKQIRNSVAPIHSIMPQLIEAYVTSILQPNSQSFHLTNEPILEDDIAIIFQKCVYSMEDGEQSNYSDNEDDEDDSEQDENEERMDVDEDETEDEADLSSGSRAKLKSKNGDGEVACEEEDVACVLTSQLLLLYYVLLYENMRLTHMKAILNSDRKVLKYSEQFLAQLPIFYLVQKTRSCKAEYGELAPPLLRLLAFHYPHLCLVKDWLPNTLNNVQLSVRLLSGKQPLLLQSNRALSKSRGHSKKAIFSTKRERDKFLKAFKSPKSSVQMSFNLVNDAFEQLLHLPEEYLWPLAPDFVSKMSILLDESVPRLVAMNARSVWLRLNHIFPTKLWVMTVNELNHGRNQRGRNFCEANTWSDIVMNPLIVLNCDRRVFRTPELMDITLHILNGFLSASKIMSTHYLMEKPSRNLEEEKKRDELKVTVQSLTEAAAIQCLLECCLHKESDFASTEEEDNTSSSDESDEQEDKANPGSSSSSVSNDQQQPAGSNRTTPNMLSNLREVQGLICTHLHQCFIADVNLAKLVHFQGYQRELLPLVVAGIPSMHICLDFLPELLNQLELDKQSFAMDLCSHLCAQYPIQRFFNVAKLCVAIAVTHLSVLPSERRATFYLSILPALQRMCEVFPPLIEELIKLLVQLAQKNKSRLSAQSNMNLFTSLDSFSFTSTSFDTDQEQFSGDDQFDSNVSSNNLVNMSWSQFESEICVKMKPEEALSLAIHKAFAMMCKLGLVSKVFKEEDLL